MFNNIRKNFSEWAIGCGMFLWGLILYTHPDVFHTSSNFEVMRKLGSIELWTGMAMIVGAIRIIAITVDRCYSYHVRMITAALSATGWAALWIAYFSIGSLIPNLATIGTLFALDIHFLWHVSSQAKKRDVLRKK